jgi:hypothetical protein
MYSKESYRQLLLTIIQSGYRVVDFADMDPTSDERQVVLRHDVDFIPRLALEAAQINESCGVRATFFILVRSHVYNLFSRTNLDVLGEIERRGHAVALHCGLPTGVPEREDDLVKLVQEDLALGALAFPRMARLYAWHTVPAQFFERWRGLSVPGLVNAYEDRYFTQIAFLSDSNARLSPEVLQETFRRGVHRKVQLLLHPVIWFSGGATMMEVLSNAWSHFIREIEVELSTNDTYRRALPHGVPDATIRAFSAALFRGEGGSRP